MTQNLEYKYRRPWAFIFFTSPSNPHPALYIRHVRQHQYSEHTRSRSLDVGRREGKLKISTLIIGITPGIDPTMISVPQAFKYIVTLNKMVAERLAHKPQPQLSQHVHKASIALNSYLYVSYLSDSKYVFIRNGFVRYPKDPAFGNSERLPSRLPSDLQRLKYQSSQIALFLA